MNSESQSVPNHVWPAEFRSSEDAAIRERRTKVSGSSDDDPVCGLALSGGGIRSATFALGVIQAMARHKVLRRVDYLSTVSGGGYAGSFLGRFFTRFDGQHKPVESVEAALADTDSEPIRWLRQHGKYISPGGSGDVKLSIAAALRNFLTLHFVLAVFVFTSFGLLNAVRYGVFDRLVSLPVEWGDLPLGSLLQSFLGVFWSPWFILAELLLLLWVVPNAIAYWLVSPERPRAFHGPAFILVFALLAGLLFTGLQLKFLLPGLALFGSFVAAELAWRRCDREEAAYGTGSQSSAANRPRIALSRSLSNALWVFGIAAGFALVDTLGHGLQQKADENQAYTTAFAALGATLMAGWPLLQRLTDFLGRFFGSGKDRAGGMGAKFLTMPVVQALLVFPVAAIPLVAVSFASHAAFDGGSAVRAGLIATLAALFVSIVLTLRSALPIINRTALSAMYASRLARAYLGATNPARRSGPGTDIDQPVPGDDVPAMSNYQPWKSGGPIHFINVCLNQTVALNTSRGTRDRKGENMVAGPFGLTVGRERHARWCPGQDCPEPSGEMVEAIAREPGQLHPFVAYDRHPDGMDQDAAGARTPERLRICVERLSLRWWVGISGAAFAPGLGAKTTRFYSLLMTLANARLGYWWNSGLEDSSRTGFPSRPFFGRINSTAARFFLTQTLLLSEALARFFGPLRRYWYLSDGGHFENMGLYELIRRRVPYIIVADASADPAYQFDDLADAIRKARIDFGTEITPLDQSKLTCPVPKEFLGTAGELHSANGNRRATHSTLFRALHRDGSESVILYLKASVTGDEPADVLCYHAQQPEFPHQSTSDQFYDEGQWECYRKLGEHIGDVVFKDGAPWFFSIPRAVPSTTAPAPSNRPRAVLA